jgi:two-component system, OmpR family, alkaline phosphatase synthesis response regulator PhoP
VSDCVLVVDDDPSILAVVTDVLLDEGYRVVAASNGAEALRRMAADVPAVLVTDLTMPVMDGHSLVEACRAQRHMDAMPIVVMSAEARAGFDSVSNLGVQELLTKPFDIGRLLEVLARLLALSLQ